MEEVLSASTARADFRLVMMFSFAFLALALAAIGVYGLVAHNLKSRQAEVAVRLALGADRVQVQRMILAQGARLTAVGLAVGLVASFVLADLLSGLLFGVASHDLLVFFAAAIVSGVAALVATWVPAARAGRLNPVTALRHE
jgi:ABC-type antimicrobial peptide transport system permease subunit